MKMTGYTQRCFTAMLVAWAPVFFTGCVTSQQLTQFDSNIIKTQEMIQTSQSESKADSQALNNQLNDLKIKMDQVNKQINEMTAMIEEYKNTLQKLTQTVNQLSSRSQSDPGGFQSLPFQTQIPGSLPPSTNPLEQRPEQIYQTAYNDYINRKFDLAIVEFNEFIFSFPESDLADNAQYWIGECYYAQSKFSDAIIEFEKVVAIYPTGDKIIASMLKLGLSRFENGDLLGAKKVLEDLINRFPFSEEARIAEDRLKNIRKAK